MGCISNRSWVALGRAATGLVVLLLAAGIGASPAAAALAVGPAELAELPEPVRADELLAWAEAHDQKVWQRRGLAAVQAAQRRESGLLTELWSLEPALAQFLAALTPAEMEALAVGRVLLLGQTTPAAVDHLRSGFPSLFNYDPRAGMLAHVPTEAERRAVHNQGRAQPLTDEEWQPIWERESRLLDLRSRFAALPWQPTLALGLHVSLELLDAGQQRVGTRRDLAWLPGDGMAAPAFGQFDAISIVPLTEVPANLGATQTFDLLAVTDPPLPRVVIDQEGEYTLAQLASMLDRWRPHTVDAAFADETLFVGEGDYDSALLEEAVQRASGLVWRAEVTDEGRMLVLGLHPPTPEALPNLATLVLPHWPTMVAAAMIDGPFDVATLAKNGTATHTLSVADLSGEQLEWVAERVKKNKWVTERGVQWFGDRVADTELRDATVVIRARLQCSFGMVNECGEHLNMPLYNLLTRVGYGLSVGTL